MTKILAVAGEKFAYSSQKYKQFRVFFSLVSFASICKRAPIRKIISLLDLPLRHPKAAFRESANLMRESFLPLFSKESYFA